MQHKSSRTFIIQLLFKSISQNFQSFANNFELPLGNFSVSFVAFTCLSGWNSGKEAKLKRQEEPQNSNKSCAECISCKAEYNMDAGKNNTQQTARFTPRT